MSINIILAYLVKTKLPSMSRIIICLVLTAISTSICGQNLSNIIWENSVGKYTNRVTDSPKQIFPVQDGGSLILGEKHYEESGPDYFGVQWYAVDHEGAALWSGGGYPFHAYPVYDYSKFNVVNCPTKLMGLAYTATNGGYDCTDERTSNPKEVSQSDINITWKDHNGVSSLSRCFGTADDDYLIGFFNDEISCESYILAEISGDTSTGDFVNEIGSRDLGIIKINEGNDLLWAKNYGSSKGDRVLYAAFGNEHLYAIVAPGANDGLFENAINNNYWLLIFDTNGELVSKNQIDSLNPEFYAQNIIRNEHLLFFNDSTLFLYGDLKHNGQNIPQGHHDTTSTQFQVPGDGFIFKISTSGKIEMDFYGGTNQDRFLRVQKFSENSLLASGLSYSTDGNLEGMNHISSNAWMMEINLAGEITRQTSFKKLNSGNKSWVIDFYVGVNNEITCLAVGKTESSKYLIYRLSGFPSITTDIYQHVISPSALFPNPAILNLNIKSEIPLSKVTIINNLGQTIISEPADHPFHNAINLVKLEPGVYQVILNYRDGSHEARRILKTSE